VGLRIKKTKQKQTKTHLKDRAVQPNGHQSFVACGRGRVHCIVYSGEEAHSPIAVAVDGQAYAELPLLDVGPPDVHLGPLRPCGAPGRELRFPWLVQN